MNDIWVRNISGVIVKGENWRSHREPFVKTSHIDCPEFESGSLFLEAGN